MATAMIMATTSIMATASIKSSSDLTVAQRRCIKAFWLDTFPSGDETVIPGMLDHLMGLHPEASVVLIGKRTIKAMAFFLVVPAVVPEYLKHMSDFGMGSDDAYIYNVATHPKHQRKGLALQMMQMIEEEARKRNLKRLLLHVFGDNQAAIALYIRLKFNVLRAETDGFLMQKLI